MNPTHESNDERLDDIGRLIRLAGPREAVEPERYATAQAHVRAHWQATLAARRRDRRRLWQTAIAAGLLVALVVPLATLLTPRPADAVLATVERTTGSVVVVSGDDTAGAAATVGTALPPGTSIETGPRGGLALRLAGGQSLRLDRSTRLAMHAPDRLSLDVGAVYIDTVPAHRPTPIAVQTALGVARDVGTQFQVRVGPDTLVVGVRDGLVEVTRPDGAAAAVDDGQFFTIAADGDTRRQAVPGDDERWNWVHELAPPFDIDGATLAAFLEWYAGERGLELKWTDARSASRARATVLSGSIEGMSLDEAIDVVRRIAEFDYRQDADTIEVTVQ